MVYLCLLIWAPVGLFWSCGNRTSDDKQLIAPDANWSEEGEFEDKVSTYEDENRDIWQKPDRVIDLLGPLNDKTVVDIGAGTGYFAFRLLSEAHKVIAVEIDEEFTAFLHAKKAQLPAHLQKKFEVRLAQPDDPMLAPSEADAILLVNTYAYMDDRITYFDRLKSKLTDQAKIVIIEFKMNNIPNGPPTDEKVSSSSVATELRQAGYSEIHIDDQTLDYQYIVTARR